MSLTPLKTAFIHVAAALLSLLSRMPFAFLCAASTCIVYPVLRYVVRRNLAASFPERSEAEWRGLDIVQQAVDEGHDFVCCYLSHFCNWEWCVGLPLQRPEIGLCQIYHPPTPPVFDAYFRRLEADL